VRDFLHELAVAAAEGLPGMACSVTLVRDDALVPVADSDPRARRIDASGVDGPHRLAAEQRAPVHIADIDADGRWPEFSELVRSEDFRSTFTAPVDVDDDQAAIGLLTFYSPEPHVFDSTARQQHLNRYAGETSRALSLATRLAASERTAWHLEDALSARAIIDYAIGIVMAQRRCDADTAFEVLRSESQRRNVKLRAIARELVTQVSTPSEAG
jgi:hypothetical protein